MEKIKGALTSILVIAIIVIVPAGIFTNVINWFFDAIKWVLFIDNAETGLPFLTEIIVKAICESLVTAIAVSIGVSQKSPLVTIASIIVGFLVCMLFYLICKYIIWILVALGILVIGLVIFYIIQKKRHVVK